VTLTLGDTPVTYAHGPQRATQITWPGTNGMSNARLTFDPAPAASTGVLESKGPWALFRLFDQGSLEQSGSDRYLLRFQKGERQASFEIRAGSVQNPFARSLLKGFQCPKL
jgi:type VI secretion system protein ImpL